jgi:formyltetrahydrofolate deformylase
MLVRVDHRRTVEDLARLGVDVERITLSRAVRWHCERVIRYGNQTVVF